MYQKSSEQSSPISKSWITTPSGFRVSYGPLNVGLIFFATMVEQGQQIVDLIRAVNNFFCPRLNLGLIDNRTEM
jgi:hypothetical protein